MTRRSPNERRDHNKTRTEKQEEQKHKKTQNENNGTKS